MTNQFKVNPGLSIFRQTGGTAGTDEIQISHNGTYGLLESKTGGITFKSGSRTLALNGTALTPDSASVLDLGSVSNYFSTVYGSALTSAGNLTLTPGGGDKVIVSGTITATELDTTSIQRGSAGSVSLFADAGANNITIGGSTSTLIVAGNLQINGTTTTVESTNMLIDALAVIVNNGGNTSTSGGSGIDIQGDSAAIVGFMRVASGNVANLEFKAPTGDTLTVATTANSTLAMSANLTVTSASTIDQNLSTTSDVSFDTVTSTGVGTNAITGSVVVGSATGGSQGAGTINATGLFINGTAVAAGITELSELSDVDITSVASGDVLYYDGSQWANALPGSTSGVQAWNTNLDTISGLSQGTDQFIVSNGTNWTSSTVSLSQIGAPTGNFGFGGHNLTGLANPVNPQDAATKEYVDAAVAGLNVHESVNAATTAALTATYTAGTTGADTGTGVGATLTNSGTQAALVIDGYTTFVGDRILVKNQATQTQNGVYVVSNVGSVSTNWVLTRATDYDNHEIGTDVAAGDFTFVQHGSINATTGWIQTGTNPITIGSSNLTFTQFSVAGVYSAGTGLTLTGTQFSITNVGTAGTYFQVTTNGQGQVTAGSNPTTLAGFGITDAQGLNANLTDISAISQGSNEFIVSNGTHFVAESGDTARHALGLGTADTATFTGVNIGIAGATSNTYVLYNTTHDATSTELYLDGSVTELLIADGKTWAFEVIVAARRTDAGTEAARFTADGAIARFGAASTTALIGDNDTSVSAVDSDWTAVVSANATTGALIVTVTGEAAKTIKWTAFVRIVEAS